MIKNCIVVSMILSKCNDQLLNNIIEALSKQLSIKDQAATITASNAIKYWKFPGEYNFVLTIFSRKIKNLNDFVGMFDLSWFMNNGAVWSKIEQPEKTFLFDEINWVHVYDRQDLLKKKQLNYVVFERKLNLFYQYYESKFSSLNMLASFFVGEIGEGINNEIIEKILNVKDEEFLGFSLKRLNGNFHLNYLFLKTDDLVIPVDELIGLIKIWQELTHKKVCKIIISNNINGKIEISNDDFTDISSPN